MPEAKVKTKEKILLVFISILIAMGLGELFIRHFSNYGIDRYLARGSNFWEAQSGLHRPSETLGYEPIPNSSPEINSFGMFDKEYPLQKRQGTYRIVIHGDSITAHSQYSKLLEDMLNNSGFDRNFEVWNCAVGGYNIEQYVNYLKYKAIKYNPDMVIIAFCLNDFIRGIPVVYKTKNGQLIEYYNPYSRVRFLMNRFLFKYSYLYRFLMVYLEKTLLGAFLSQPRSSEEAGYMNLKTIKAISDRRNIELLGIIFPYLKPLNEYTKQEQDCYGQMVKVLKELKINFLDLYPFLMKTDLSKFRKDQADIMHFSGQGDMAFSDTIYDYLKGKFINKNGK